LTAAARPRLAIDQRVPPHALRSDVLAEEECAALLAWTLAHEADFVPSKIGAGDIRTEMRNSLTLRQALLREWRPLFREQIGALLPGLLTELGMAPFEMGRIEVQLIAYRDGAFYGRHRDIGPREGKRGMRAVSAVYYFHSEPKGFEGGALRLTPIAADAAGFADVAPWNNGLLAFPAWAPHEVRPVRCASGRFEDARFAVNCWIHVREPGE
jgi:SM-20-related protein